MFLKYKCTAFHTQVGSETVTCYNDGTWSQLPVCKGMNKLIRLLFISKSLSKMLPKQLSMLLSVHFVQRHSVSSNLSNLLGEIYNFLELNIWRKERGRTFHVFGTITAACFSALMEKLVLLTVSI